ncbi:MAG: SulP family inorganic anion transporter [Verrucomicrobiota bacterium]
MRKLRAFVRGIAKDTKAFVVDNNLEAFPIRESLKRYSLWKFRKDSRAGINVALLAFPQGMAYAVIAGLPIHYGITCGAVASIVAPLLSGSRHTILGPTNATAFMVFSYFAAYPHPNKEQVMPLLVFMVGVMLVLGAYFRFAELIQYVSRSVVVGYITGAALLIIANQASHILGLYPEEPVDVGGEGLGQPRTFFGVAWQTVQLVPKTHLVTLLLSLLTLGVFLLLNWKFKGWPVFALTLVVMSVVAGVANQWLGSVDFQGGKWAIETFSPFALSELAPEIPRFSEAGILSDMSQLFGVAFAVAFLASLENSVMSKTLASRTGDRPDVNQDMLSVGAANLGTAFLSGMPASGSLTRSALNFASGAVTPLASIISGVLLIGGLLVVGKLELIRFVPKCSLAVLVICIAASLFHWRHIRTCLFATRSDAVVLLVTFVSALVVPLNIAIFLGVGASIVLYLRKAAKPYLVEYEFNEDGHLAEADQGGRAHPAISIVHVEGELFFGAAELFRTQIQRICEDPNLRVIILRMKNAHHLDATSVMALEDLIEFLRGKNRHLIMSGLTKDVYRVIKQSGISGVVGRENIFFNTSKNPNLSTRNALLRAQELLGTKDAEVRIYYDPHKE